MKRNHVCRTIYKTCVAFFICSLFRSIRFGCFECECVCFQFQILRFGFAFLFRYTHAHTHTLPHSYNTHAHANLAKWYIRTSHTFCKKQQKIVISETQWLDFDIFHTDAGCWCSNVWAWGVRVKRWNLLWHINISFISLVYVITY